MPASAPSAVIHGDDLDLTLGPNAEITKCYYDGAVTIAASHAKKTKYTAYNAHNAGAVMATPEYKVTCSVIIKRETGPLAQAHPGSGLTRSVIACAGDRGGHGFPMDLAAPGYFIFGDASRTFDVGVHSKLALEAELFNFTVTNPIAGAA